MISRDANIIKRHRNPVGIFSRMLIYPVAVFAGLWRRSWRLLAASAALIATFYLLMRSVAAKS